MSTQITHNHLPSDNNIDWSEFLSTVIIEVTKFGKVYTSTAVAISENVLLTAAHSVDNMDSAKVLIGRSYKQAVDELEVKRCVIHPNYDPKKSFYKNDLAIIILEESLPACVKLEKLPITSQYERGDTFERIGFGGRNQRNRRTWTNPTYKSRTFDCKSFILEDEMSVVGDSGGPIFRHHKGEVELIGIHSTLEGGSQTYIVNLAPYRKWIEANLEIYKV